MRVRRFSLKYLLPAAGAFILACAGLIFMLISGRPPRPNIILISIDTLRADRLGCYGCPTGTSPNIDAFSRGSVQFLQETSQAPNTTPSHMSLFTGLLPPVHRVSGVRRSPDGTLKVNLSSLGAGIPTLAQYLKENGYRTVGLHGGGLVAPVFGFDRGFDRYTDKRIPWQRLYENPSSLQIIQRLLHPTHPTRQPLFLFLHTYICHDPYTKAPQEIRKRFLPDPVPGLPIESDSMASFDNAHDAFWKPIDGSDQDHRRHVRALYDAGVNYADWIFGEIVALLKKSGAYDKALVVVVSDHGEEFWEHGGTLHRNLFIETLHVPLLIKFPGGKFAGRKIAAPVGQFALMPTLLDYLRIAPRLKPQSRSLLPLISGTGTAPGPVLSFDNGLQFVRIQQDGFVYANGIQLKPGDWLFDSIPDPGEQHDLAAADFRAVRQMRALAAKIMAENLAYSSRIKAGVPDPSKLPQELQRQLKALGYL
jgi:arylsulfatase A-like enzyme